MNTTLGAIFNNISAIPFNYHGQIVIKKLSELTHLANLDFVDIDNIIKAREWVSIASIVSTTDAYCFVFKELEELNLLTDKIFTIALLDIDHFKKINDNHGHLAGDYILKKFVASIHKNIRPYDLLARYGGEEFIILFVDCLKEEAQKALLRIKSSIKKSKFVYKTNPLKFTFSAGMSQIDEVTIGKGKPEKSITSLIQLADGRLYQAKKGGRNKIII